MKVLRYVWAFPNTAIGLLFVPFALVPSVRLCLVDGVVEICGGPIAFILRHLIPLPGGAAAITFGHVVLGRDPQTLDVTRRHERVHVRQCERWGPAFIPAYLAAAGWGLVTSRDPYRGNYFERDAFRSE